ncbi:MAG: FHA domain-containing protein [Sumerlaeia bacterium]
MATQQKLRLVARSGPQQGRIFSLCEERIALGRDASCELRLDDPKVSRIHAFFERKDDEVYFRDNRSTNGSLINGVRVTQQKVNPGDIVQVGGTEFAVMEDDEFTTIQFISGESVVTHSVEANSVTPDKLAEKFASVFAQYSDIRPKPGQEIPRQIRLVGGIKALFRMSHKLSQLLPMEELMHVVADGVFEMFPGAENVAVLLRDPDAGRITSRFARNRSGEQTLTLQISSTVLNRAIQDKSTVLANDASSDQRFSASESILGFEVKSVVCAPLVAADKAIGAIYLDNRAKEMRYDEFDSELITAYANQCAVAVNNCRLCDDLQESYHQMLQSLVNAIEAKDPYTAGHTQRVKEHTIGIAQELDFEPDRLVRLEMAAELHDIGKIALEDGLINKPGRLTETEFHTIKSHVEMGEKILQPITYLRDLLPWIRGHHERWDGKGYPDGRRGEQTPLEGRILAVADSFDAMTSQRSYNKPMTFQEGLQRVKADSGKHFDPAVVEAFERYIRRRIEADEADSDPEGGTLETMRAKEAARVLQRLNEQEPTPRDGIAPNTEPFKRPIPDPQTHPTP